MMTDLIRIGFIGGGWVTCNRHIQAAASIPNFKLNTLITRDNNLVNIQKSDLSAKYGISHIGSSLDLLDDTVDAVIIGTPPNSHAGLVRNALSRGKHVLVEKPFTATSEEALQLIQQARSAGLILAVIHNLQFSRAATQMKTYIQNGEVGDVQGVFGFQSSNHKRRLPVWYKTLPLGLFSDESPHLLYIIRALIGESQQHSTLVVPSLDKADNTPHIVTTHFTTPAHITATLHMNFVGSLSEWHVVVWGSKQTAILDLFRDIAFLIPDDNRHESLDVLRTSMSATIGHMRGFVNSGAKHISKQLHYGNDRVMQLYHDAIRSGSQPDYISAQEGLINVEMIEHIHNSSQNFSI